MPSKLRRLAGPAIATAFMLVVLVGLGTWQLQRLAWKNALTAQIVAGENAAAIPLPADPSPFEKVRVEGVFWKMRAYYGAQVRDRAGNAVYGTQLIAPLMRPGSEPILIVLGWVPWGDSQVALPSGSVQGFVHPAEGPNWLSARDDPASRHFYTLDPQAIGRALGFAHVMPFTLVALGPDRETPPLPAQHLPVPENNHLSYAITWFSFALILGIVFTAWSRKALRA